MAIIYKKYEQVARKLYPDANLLQVEPLAGGVSADVLRLDLRLTTGELRSIVMRDTALHILATQLHLNTGCWKLCFVKDFLCLNPFARMPAVS